MNAITKFLNRLSTIPVLIIFCILFGACIVYVLPHQKAATAVYSHDVGSVGLSFFPIPDRIYEMAEGYGEEGRRAYIKVWLTYDLLWPFVYTVFFLVCINLLWGYVHGAKGSRLCAVAVPPLILDYVENVIAIILMARYPVRMDGVAWVLTFATGLKWIGMGVVFGMVAYGILAVPVRFICMQVKRQSESTY